MTERLQWEKNNDGKHDNSDQTHNQQISDIIPDVLYIKHLYVINHYIFSFYHINEAAVQADFLH